LNKIKDEYKKCEHLDRGLMLHDVFVNLKNKKVVCFTCASKSGDFFFILDPLYKYIKKFKIIDLKLKNINLSKMRKM